jgi:hypothetical protein
MSSDEQFLVEILRALESSGLEAIFVGLTAAVLQGAPVTTQDVDLLVRDTPRNREKIRAFGQAIGARAVERGELARVETLLGAAAPVDMVFDGLPGDLTFESIRSRSVRKEIAGHTAVVASLADIIASKEAAGRPKDLAALPILRDTLVVKEVMEE